MIDPDPLDLPSLGLVSESTSLSNSSHRSVSSSSSGGPLTVVVIGCGPGGMSFLHALATRRKKLKDMGDLEALERLPVVSCFERSSSPGGVWRSEVNASVTTNMYEGLWINCAKEAMEFKDYTFDDHFGGPLPVYLPRKSVLEYMLARVTSQENIFQSVQFNTTVRSVTYDKEMNEFLVITLDNVTNEATEHRFDKCIWAGGLNGSPYFATEIVDMLKTKKFRGQVVHSTEMGSLTTSVQGKRIMMVGDSYSAEDLALQCLKLGAERIFITTRKSRGMASYVGAWPGDRVEMLWWKMLHNVTENGYGIICKNTYDDEVVEINDISIIIFCTGYEPNLKFLSPELSSWYTETENATLSVKKDWKMKRNTLSTLFGDVEPSIELKGQTSYMKPGLYRNLLISNPNMMFLFESTGHPLLEIDVKAWLCLGYICCDVEVPTAQEMEKRNSLQLLQEMQEPWIRYHMDQCYREKHWEIPDDHWYYHYDSEGYFNYCVEGFKYNVKLIARDTAACDYPLNLGNYNELNSTGEKLAYMTAVSCAARYNLKSDSEDKSWRTFRDCDPSAFSSLITGTKATRLSGRWMEIDDEGKNVSNERKWVSGDIISHLEVKKVWKHLLKLIKQKAYFQ